MGKKRYDSSSDMSYGSGTKPKANPRPMATDTSTLDLGRSYKAAGANVTDSRLDKGGSKAYKGKRSSAKHVSGGRSYSKY